VRPAWFRPVALLLVTLANAAVAAPSAPLLWRVERGGRTSYLFGTVHVPLDLDSALGAEGRAALADAKRVFLELDFAPENLLAFLRQAVGRGELPPDRSLHTLLRPSTWDRLKIATRNHVDPVILDRMEPWFVGLFVVHLAVPHGRVPHGVRPGLATLDAQIDARARQRHIPVEALESTLDHLQVMSRMPRREAVAMVEEAIANPEGSREELEGLVGAYVAADDRPLRKTFGRLVRRKPVLADRLLTQRNEAWCERLDRWLGDGRMFVAAGTFHMFGDRGLVALLTRRGYRVERVGREPDAPSS
jgi:uncharacterized protein